ncbi:MAG: histidine--tRNA ligase [Thermodesulfobacteriota bacterium]
MNITAVRGFNDILPDRSELWRHIEDEARRIFSCYGFSEIRVPVVERTELFSRSIGETTDIVEKEMYTFTDRRGDSLTLRPEGTAPVVRAYIEHKLYNEMPVARLYYTGPMYRYERPQKRRYRQFYQIGAEVLGETSPGVDAEVIEGLVTLFKKLGVVGATLHINSLGCPECRPRYKEKLEVFLETVKEKLCGNCLRRIEANPLRALDCKNPGCIEATGEAPAILEAVCGECGEHFTALRGHLGELGIEYTVNPRMVRGLDYYTKTTFEITAEGLGSQNAVAAGGRYDGLVKELGGPDTPCFGFAIGMERLVLLLEERSVSAGPLTVLIAMGEEAGKKGTPFVRVLRERGKRVVVDYGDGSLKNRMKRAHRTGARFVVIVGEDELADGVVTVKDMESGGQDRLPPEKAVDRIAAEGV